MKTWWVSFAKEKNLGVVIVDAVDEMAGLARINKLGLNPGGEAMICPMGTSADALAEIAYWGKDRLISPAELRAEKYKSLPELSEAERQRVANHPATRICEDCASGKPHGH